MKYINHFFNELRVNAGAIWLDNETIKLSAPKKFQNQETRDFITINKSEIISILRINHIFSQEEFFKIIILKNHNTDFYPLSPAQERLWFIEQYEQGTNAYHMPRIFELDITTDIRGMKYALECIVWRHEVLRSTIEQREDLDHGIQVVHDASLFIEDSVL
ncbi:condensation domain-containing protein, partial [Flavobacterium sp. T12S277]|uniref:condensation domain-containing protein n=1 Tax=Flavobacterium sp. T12S277 TaxID=3402752 RepID=UPI003AD826DB